MSRFFNPTHMAEVNDVIFRLRICGEKVSRARRVLVISTHGLSEPAAVALRAAYLEEFGGDVSFPLRERAKHLMTRIDGRIFNFGRAVVNWLPRFRVKPLRLPRARALEMVLKLAPAESARLQVYLGHILKNRARTIGKFRMEGNQYTVGRPDHNITLTGGHNCSSWIATAPLGPASEPLLEMLGGSRELEIGTNPGWWTNWLAVAAPEERITILHWTPLPLADALAEIQPGRRFAWDFNRH